MRTVLHSPFKSGRAAQPLPLAGAIMGTGVHPSEQSVCTRALLATRIEPVFSPEWWGVFRYLLTTIKKEKHYQDNANGMNKPYTPL
jgi:hypothetical protein